MKNDLTDITLVLDRSGSMASVREDTIGDFNTFLTEQKAIPGSANLTLVQFDDKYDVLYEGRPLPESQPLSTETFVPRGSTALLDAIGRTIVATGARLAAQPEDERAGKVLFVIMTDGEENASHEFSSQRVFEMITRQREKYRWQIVSGKSCSLERIKTPWRPGQATASRRPTRSTMPLRQPGDFPAPVFCVIFFGCIF